MWRVALSALHTLYIQTPTHQPPHSTLHRPHSTLQTPLYSAHMGSCFGVFAVRTQKKALSSTLLCDIVQQMENCFFFENAKHDVPYAIFACFRQTAQYLLHLVRAKGHLKSWCFLGLWHLFSCNIFHR